jgi:hypothetical protein
MAGVSQLVDGDRRLNGKSSKLAVASAPTSQAALTMLYIDRETAPVCRISVSIRIVVGAALTAVRG